MTEDSTHIMTGASRRPFIRTRQAWTHNLLLVAFSASLLTQGVARTARADEALFSDRTFADMRLVCGRLVDSLNAAYEEQLIEEPLRYLRLGVVEFEETGRRAAQHRAGMVLSDWMAGCLFEEHRLRLVERRRLDTVAGECSDLMRTGREERAMKCLGQLDAADLLVVGQVTEVTNDLMLTVRVMRIDGAVWLAAENAPLSMETTLRDIERMLDYKTSAGAALRSLSLPGWGQFYNDEPWKGAGFMATFGGLAATAAWSQYRAWQAEEDFKLKLRVTKGGLDDSARWRDWRNGFLVAASVTWAISIVDAYVNGYEYQPSKTYHNSAPGGFGFAPSGGPL